ncbi:MAG: hypothetical protein KF784_10760 [Fimbriimonadaceae bacterium]|nr:hypothetical protein [Fimbriimonadaceae bacterium]
MTRWCLGLPYQCERAMTEEERARLIAVTKREGRKMAIGITCLIGGAIYLFLISRFQPGSDLEMVHGWITLMVCTIAIFMMSRTTHIGVQQINLKDRSTPLLVEVFGDSNDLEGDQSRVVEIAKGTNALISINGNPCNPIAFALVVQASSPAMSHTVSETHVERRLRTEESIELRKFSQGSGAMWVQGFIFFATIILIREEAWASIARNWMERSLAILTFLLIAVLTFPEIRNALHRRKLRHDLEYGRLRLERQADETLVEVLPKSGRVWTRNGLPEAWRYLTPVERF